MEFRQSNKIIFHIDLDAFFCGCEIANNPQLKDQVFVVAGPWASSRSVIGCASYPARKLGIKAAMPVFMAKKIKPDLQVVTGNFLLYEKMSQQFFDFVKTNYSPILEEMSIDECWVDVTELCKKYSSPEACAKKMQEDILQSLGLSASFGIAHSKWMAKMATDLNKPFGITSVLTQADIEAKIWPLAVEEMFGVGPKTAPVLRSLEINTIGDLAKCEDVFKLKCALKRNWFNKWIEAKGVASDPVDPVQKEPKSLSISRTLTEESVDLSELELKLQNLAKELETRLKEHNMESFCIGLIYRVKDGKPNFKNDTTSIGIKSWTEISNKAIELLNQYWDKHSPIKLIGIAVSILHKLDEVDLQMRLF